MAFRTVVMKKDGSVEVLRETEKDLPIGAVWIRTICSEICGTDVHLRKGHLAGVPFPIVPGHVAVGVIEKINGEVKEVEGESLKVGDVVTYLDVHETCNSCWYCLVAKTSTRCPNRKVYGITYPHEEGFPLGGWSEYVLLKPGVKILKFPPQLKPEVFMAAGCGLPTAIHAVQRADIQLGDSVAVQGSGPVGLMAAILAKLRGAFTVIMLGAPAHRLEIAKEFGVDHIINIQEKSVEERRKSVQQLTNGRGVDVCIECTGVPSAVPEGMELTRNGGTYVVVGQYTNAGNTELNPHHHINAKHITIKGSWGSDFSHFYLAVKLMAKYCNNYPWSKLISRSYDLSEIDQALKDVEQLTVMKALVAPRR